jgi:DNA-binding transcriptional MocR family regulator
MMDSSQPHYRRIAAELDAQMLAGMYLPGQRLPSVRALALSHGVNTLTALQAYRWLEQNQRVIARERSGFFVAAALTSGESDGPAPGLPTPGAWVHVDDRVSTLLSLANAPLDVSFHMAEAEPSLYPAGEIARRLQHKLSRDPALLGAYLPPEEQRLLGDALQRLAAGWQLDLPSDQWLITHGSTEAIQLALRCLTRTGDVVAVETPVYFGLLQTIESLGLRVLEIPCTPQHGLSIEALEFALQHGPQIRAVVVVPNFQNPTGALMPDDNKRRLLALLARQQIPLIEDDVFGDLHFGGERPTPIKAWDRDGNVIYCSSFTKTLAPALRLGWMSGGRHHRRLERLKVSNSYVSSALMQATLADCLISGLYARQLRQLRHQLGEQCRRLSAAVRAAFPLGTRVAEPAGGMLLWIQCPEGVDTLQLLQSALTHSISFAPGLVFSAEPRFTRCLRLNIGHPWSPAIERAVATLGRLAKAQLQQVADTNNSGGKT